MNQIPTPRCNQKSTLAKHVGLETPVVITAFARQLETELAAMTQEIAEIKADAERFRRLARECYLPDDHPENSVAVIVPESIVPLGGFTLDPDNDLKSLRIAVDNMP